MKKKVINKLFIFCMLSLLIIESFGIAINTSTSASSKKNNSTWLYTPDIIVPDDYSSIQLAINSLGNNKCIGVRNGIYHEHLQIYGNTFDNLILVGESRNYTIITGDDIANLDIISINDADNVIISNFSITGSGKEFNMDAARFLYFGINCTDSKDISIQYNNIYDNGNGIAINDGSRVILTNDSIINNKDDGVEGNGQFYIYNCIISHNGYGLPSDVTNGDGIEIMRSARPSEIVGNTISYNTVDGIWDETVDDHIISDNNIHHNGQSGIHLEEGRDCKIRNNIIYENGRFNFSKTGSGILFLQSTSNIIDNNKIFRNNYGILLVQSNRNEISDNEIYGNIGAGILLYQNSGDGITGNIIHDNNIGLYLLNSNGFKIKFNDIYLNAIYGMISILSFGDSTFNWWGGAFGPYMGAMLRLPPLLNAVVPWSFSRNNPEVI